MSDQTDDLVICCGKPTFSIEVDIWRCGVCGSIYHPPSKDKVWIVWDNGDYYTSVIRGVFRTEEEAEAHRAACAERDPGGVHSVDSYEFGPTEELPATNARVVHDPDEVIDPPRPWLSAGQWDASVDRVLSVDPRPTPRPPSEETPE